MGNFIAFLVFMAILGFALSAVFTTYIALNKGREFQQALILSICLPFISIIIIAMMSSTDAKIAEEMYSRNMIDLEKLEETREIILKKNEN